MYRTEESQRSRGAILSTLNSQLSTAPRQYLKDGIVFSINRNRMDEAKLNEDAATAGEWIQYIELWPADSYPGFDRLVFPPAQGR